MEWITKEEIARRGKISPYEAFTVSIKKYEQWLCASAKELKEAIRNGKTNCSASHYCGCCTFYSSGCSGCPLDDEGDTCCVEWRTLERGDQTNKDSIRAMLCRLYQERDKLPKEEKKPCKEEKLEPGDYGANNGMPWIHIAGKTYWWNTPSPSENSNESFIRSRDGNIFTDLEALKEPLKEFEMPIRSQKVKVHSCWGVELQIIGGNTLYFPGNNKAFEEFILNLRRLVATAKSKQSSLK